MVLSLLVPSIGSTTELMHSVYTQNEQMKPPCDREPLLGSLGLNFLIYQMGTITF